MSNVEAEKEKNGVKCSKCGQVKTDIAKRNESTGFVICTDCSNGLKNNNSKPLYKDILPGGKNPYLR